MMAMVMAWYISPRNAWLRQDQARGGGALGVAIRKMKFAVQQLKKGRPHKVRLPLNAKRALNALRRIQLANRGSVLNSAFVPQVV